MGGGELEVQKKIKKLKHPGGFLQTCRREHSASACHSKGGFVHACLGTFEKE